VQILHTECVFEPYHAAPACMYPNTIANNSHLLRIESLGFWGT